MTEEIALKAMASMVAEDNAAWRIRQREKDDLPRLLDRLPCHFFGKSLDWLHRAGG